jgi:hypothetical protein
MTRWMGWALVLALMGSQLGCGSHDRDGDGIHDGADCAPDEASTWKQVQVYDDTDGDKYGGGEPRMSCLGKTLPAGLSTQGGDCAPEDPKRWMSLTGKGYYADADGDGKAVSTLSSACVGTNLAGYLRTQGTDCDDADPKVWASRSLYADEDGDGFAEGAPSLHCVGSTPPPGLFETASDCAPGDPTRYQSWNYLGRDEDGDGFFMPVSGTLCIGEAPPVGYTSNVTARPDCDDTRADVWTPRVQYPDPDGDQVGSGPAETLCSGDGARPGYALAWDDCAPDDSARWMRHSYAWRDADGDGATVPEWGQVCGGYALPSGYSVTPGALRDCDDTRAEASVSWSVFPDGDQDGVGAGTRQTLCAGTTRPAGYADTDSDCAPEDASRWRTVSPRYRDADEDGFTVAPGGPLCLGASTAGHPDISQGPDCDDTRADVHQSLQVYADTDGDGVGADAAMTACTDGSTPAGHSLQGTDCAPADASRWRLHTFKYVDADGDGHTQPATGQVCAAATLPPPYTSAASGNDCDDADATRFLWRVLYPDHDGDGVGVPPRVVMCLDAGAPPPGYSIYGFDPDDSDPALRDFADEPELDVLLFTH